MKRRVIFRADGNLNIGYGHFIRTLGIAGIINNDFECIYATMSPTGYQANEIKKACNHMIELSKSGDHYDEFLTHLNSGDIVVLDNYYFDSDYQLKIRNIGCKVIYIDDYNDKFFVCDALINNIPGFPKETFKKSEYTKLYLGIDYALLRKEFFDPELRKVNKVNGNIFLSFGGGDIYNISEKIVSFLNEIYSRVEINLLIGDAYKYNDSLAKFDNLKIHRNISAKNVASLIAESQLCIIPASSLLNEAACIGSKILVGYFTDNQIQPYEYFVNDKMALGLGDYRELCFDLFKDKLKLALNSEFLIDNQRRRYRYQQEDNLKSIFYNV